MLFRSHSTWRRVSSGLHYSKFTSVVSRVRTVQRLSQRSAGMASPAQRQTGSGVLTPREKLLIIQLFDRCLFGSFRMRCEDAAPCVWPHQTRALTFDLTTATMHLNPCFSQQTDPNWCLNPRCTDNHNHDVNKSDLCIPSDCFGFILYIYSQMYSCWGFKS